MRIAVHIESYKHKGITTLYLVVKLAIYLIYVGEYKTDLNLLKLGSFEEWKIHRKSRVENCVSTGLPSILSR